MPPGGTQLCHLTIFHLRRLLIYSDFTENPKRIRLVTRFDPRKDRHSGGLFICGDFRDDVALRSLTCEAALILPTSRGQYSTLRRVR